jgi:hypothetical protein
VSGGGLVPRVEQAHAVVEARLEDRIEVTAVQHERIADAGLYERPDEKFSAVAHRRLLQSRPERMRT